MSAAALGAMTMPNEAEAGPQWSDVFALVRPYRGLLAGAVTCVLIGALLELAPPLIVRRVVDEHLATGEARGLLQLGLLYFGATAALQATTFLTGYLTSLAAQGALHDLRVRLFAHLQRLPMSYHDRTPVGDAISRCTSDIETIQVLFSTGVATLAAEMVRLVTVSIAMVAISPGLTLMAALVVPPLVVVTRVFQARVLTAERSARVATGALTAQLQESLAGMEIIRAFAREPHFVRRFRFALRRALAVSNVSHGYDAVYPSLTTVLAALATAWLLWVGAGWIGVTAGTQGGLAGELASLGQGLTIGTLTAFILLFGRFFKPISALGEEWQKVQSALTGAERVFSVLALAPDIRAGEAARETGRGAHGRSSDDRTGGEWPVELRDVVFGYAPGSVVLDGLTLRVKAGEHVALVGRTGAGKTSALHLLAGLYEPWSGGVRVAGANPRSIPEDERRRVMGVVPQAVHLFTGTVRENLTLFDPEVADAAMWRAAELVGASGFIEALPQRYDTPLSGGRGAGSQLSAGQRQLLALARALVWDPPVLLLDEATAAIDGASDATFRGALRRAQCERDQAILTVAHRLSTAREADRVLVMDGGMVVEEGPPEELVRAGGRFASLVALEEAGLDWERP